MDRWQTWTCHLKPWVTEVHWITGMWRHQPLNAEVAQGRHRIVPNKKQVMASQDMMISRAGLWKCKTWHAHHIHTHHKNVVLPIELCTYAISEELQLTTMTATYDIIAHFCAFNCSHNTSQIHAVENRSWLRIQACPLRRLDNVVVPRLWNHLNLSGWLYMYVYVFSLLYVQ